MNYTIIRRETKFNLVQRINEQETNIASISQDIQKDLLEIYPLINERLRTTSDKLDLERIVPEALNIKKEKKAELARVKRLEDMKVNAGFTLISIIIVLGIVGFSFVTFFVIKGILY